ncbi:MAG: hypothetical protein HY906_14825 [Deltaproteobacteria bacterium]|nr:hypothetical protein [Deltaproteobacteria bacterium]
MKRTYRFVEPSGFVLSTVHGVERSVPVLAGILKHPTTDELRALLADPAVVEKYAREALKRAPWSALRRFPRSLLLECLPGAELPDVRRKALELLLGDA